MKNLAIIPARGGSKRIPRKNIRLFARKPIIQYSILAAKESMLFSEIMVSTDDHEIAEIALQCGASVPFMRSVKNSDDFATLTDVVTEVIDCYEKRGEHFDYLCCFLPTAVFITPEILSEGFDVLRDNKYNTVIPIQRFTYPIERALQIDKSTGRVKMIRPEYAKARSQDLPDAYHDSGQFYWADVNAYKKEKGFFTSNSGFIELSSLEVQDIDIEEDWKIAEYKFRSLEGIRKI
jgi:pseudaminic acid cytidylyltransferase